MATASIFLWLRDEWLPTWSHPLYPTQIADFASLDTFVVGGMTTSNPGITVTERSAFRVTGRSKLRGSVQYPPITPATLAAGDNDDWAGLLTASPNNNGRYWARVTGNATPSVITGIDATAVQDGDTYEISNVGTEAFLLANENTGSIAANRLVTQESGGHVVESGGTGIVRYDSTDARWRVITPPASVAPLSGVWKYINNQTMADPGSGNFRTNNATIGSVTALAINDISRLGGDLSNIMSNLAAGDKVYIQNKSNGDQFLVLDVTGTTDNTTWFQIDGTINASGNNFTGNGNCTITFIFA